ncbi:MAG: cysA 3 [Marmoricola sp.]|nr:cysA 3 [Marmoricola sp.]
MTTTTQPGTRAGLAVELTDLTRVYGSNRALDGLTLHLEPGELVCLLGPSGCGKTTALRILAGLDEATSGTVEVGGKDLTHTPANKRDMGMVFQAYSLFPHMTVLDNVAFGLKLRGVDKAQRSTKAGDMLDLVGLGVHKQKFASQLSGGQQQRVALARALAIEPSVLLLDEPLSALDAKVRVQLRDEIRRVQLDVGTTTLFVTHDQEEALAVADRVAVMNAGNIEQIGTPEELYTQPSSAFVANFVGLTNRVPGELRGGAVLVHGATLPLLGAAQPDGQVTALIRPENIEFAPDGLAATVVASSFLGNVRRTQVRLADDSVLSVQHDVSEHPQTGDGVFLRFKSHAISASPTPAIPSS